MATSPSAIANRLLETLRGTIHGLVRSKEHDLTARQLAVLLVCYHEREPQTVRGLAEKLKVSRGAITRALDRLGKDDLLRREIDPLDRRSVLTARTAAGDALLREMRQIMAQAAKVAEQGRPPAPHAE